MHDGELDHIEETRQAQERGRRGIKAKPTGGEVRNLAIDGCAREKQMQVDGEVEASGTVTEDGDMDCTTASSSFEGTSTNTNTTANDTDRIVSPSQPTCVRGCCTSTHEIEVKICVGTLDEQFLVGRRDKSRNVIPNTGFGALVAHPEGRMLWTENGIPEVTDGVTGPRWKYAVDSWGRMDRPSFEH